MEVLQKQFELPQGDEEYLSGLNLDWEAVTEGGVQWLLIHGWQLPAGYNVGNASVALLIHPEYSDVQIDMVYFFPPLSRVDGRLIGAISDQPIGGKTFQRWSRHRTPQNPWRAGVDDLAAHLALVVEWLNRELKKP